MPDAQCIWHIPKINMKKSKITSRKYLVKVLILLPFFTNIIFVQENDSLKSLFVKGEYKTIVKILEEKLTWENSLTFFEYNILGNSYQRLMNFDKAILAFGRAEKINPQKKEMYFFLANIYE